MEASTERGAVPPLPLYAFMAWCSVTAQTSNEHCGADLILYRVGHI